MDLEKIVLAMVAGGGDREVQLVQTRFRAVLAETWSIAPGDRILEVGCGQGDMTAVLADRVGERGMSPPSTSPTPATAHRLPSATPRS